MTAISFSTSATTTTTTTSAARISLGGLHSFVRKKVAEAEKADPDFCRIVDAHYFRGRLRAADAEDRDLLYKERVFDDVLVREGVTTHYLPLSREGEKGIDVSAGAGGLRNGHLQAL